MKKLPITLLSVFYSLLLYAQAPQAFNYQAVVRNSGGEVLADQAVGFRLSIREGSAGGTVLYSETHLAVTNALGLVSLQVGGGGVVSGSMGDVDWGGNSFYLEVEADPAGGTDYVSMGTTQLLSVPYALHAGSSGGQHWAKDGDNIYTTNTGKVGIGTTEPLAKFSVWADFPSGSGIEDLVDISRGSNAAVLPGIGAGMVFRNEVANQGYVQAGRIASVMESVTSPYTSGMLFQTRTGTSGLMDAFYLDPNGNAGIGTTDPAGKLHVNGKIVHEYTGSENGMHASGSTLTPFYYIENTSSESSASPTAIAAGITSELANNTSKGIYGFNNSAGYAIYGESVNLSGTAVYGKNSATGAYGYAGGASHGVYGSSNNGNYGYMGSIQYGTFAYNASGTQGYLASTGWGAAGGHISSGNVGLLGGTDFGVSSIGPLKVDADGDVPLVVLDAQNGMPEIAFLSNGTEKADIRYAQGSGNLEFTTSTATLSLTDDGRLGLNKEYPAKHLHINGVDPVIRLESSSSGNVALEFFQVNQFRGSVGYDIDDGYLFFYEGGNVVVNDGCLGVGKTVIGAGKKIDVSGGAYCSGSTWYNSSDKNLKENFVAIDGNEILDKVAALDISSWNYIDEGGIRHIGPVAQDFHKLFEVGLDDRSISTVDADGISLAAIKALYEQNVRLEAQNEALTSQLADLMDRIADVEARLRKE